MKAAAEGAAGVAVEIAEVEAEGGPGVEWVVVLVEV